MNSLKSIVESQRQALARLELELGKIEESDLNKENEALKIDLNRVKEVNSKISKSLAAANDENARLKNALYEQMFSEKVAIANNSQQKSDIFFRSGINTEQNRLNILENNLRARIYNMTQTLKANNVELENRLYGELNELNVRLNQAAAQARRQAEEYYSQYGEFASSEYNRLRGEQLTGEQIAERAKKNNFERLVGLNLINKLGILLIIIGVIAASQFAYFRLNDIFKSAMMFTFGLAFIAAGELFGRKKPNIFSMGLTAGGVGILYTALSISYFALKVFGMYPALGICVSITGATFYLATRYNSQTILSFAIIGGYLPLLSITGSITLIYGAMGYFIILNLLALLISFRKKWVYSTCIGLVLTIFGTSYVCLNIISQIGGEPFGAGHAAAIAYVVMSFLIYTLIPVIGTYMEKLSFKAQDVALIAVNTIFSSAMMYVVFYAFKIQQYNGLLSAVFAVVYLVLGWLVRVKFTGEKNMSALFFLTGFTFVILIVPFQFHKEYLTLGWLVEGVLLLVYGIYKSERVFKIGGYVICSLCMMSFFLFDIPFFTALLFPYKYSAITLGSIVILTAFVLKKQQAQQDIVAYKILTILNLWAYLLYIIFRHIAPMLKIDQFNDTYLTCALAVTITFAIGFAVPKIKPISEKALTVTGILINCIGLFGLFIINSLASPLVKSIPDLPRYAIAGSVVLIGLGLLSVFIVYDLVKNIIKTARQGVRYLPLAVSIYFTVILTANLICQYNVRFTSFAISIIYVAAALLWIVFGFAKKYALMRRFGLGLSILSVAKLFIVDLYTLTSGYRIISYFVLGTVLLAISFVYQFFNKRLELK